MESGPLIVAAPHCCGGTLNFGKVQPSKFWMRKPSPAAGHSHDAGDAGLVTYLCLDPRNAGAFSGSNVEASRSEAVRPLESKE